MKSETTKSKIPSVNEIPPIKLSEYQQLVLAKASQNKDAFLIDRPKGTRGATGLPKEGLGASARDQRTVDALLRKGLVEGDRKEVFDLRLTALAFVSLHIDECEWPKRLRRRKRCSSGKVGPTEHNGPLASLRSGTKSAKVLELVSSKGGASLHQIEQATGWQPHSVRGFISGTLKKKLGLEVVSQLSASGQRTYRIAGQGQ